MITVEDKATVLCRMALPLIQLAKDKECAVQFRLTDTTFNLEILEKSEGKREFFDYYHVLDSNGRDWNMSEKDGEKLHVCFRTFESMKEILWRIREALS